MNTPTPTTSTDDVVTGLYTLLPYDQLHRSPTNPRKHYAEGPLKDLASSICKLGVQTALHVRRSPYQPGLHEIIAGERRHRGVEMAMGMIENEADAGERIASLMQLPVKIVNWDDATVIEFQLIENLQREDLTPLEEADGYAQLLQRGSTVEHIAERIGRAPNHIYRALKWARLPELARRAFELGLIAKEMATLIARIPEERAQRVATVALVFFKDEWIDAANVSDKDLAQYEKDAWKYLDDPESHDEITPESIRTAREEVARHFMSSLVGAGIDLDDADLLAVEWDVEGRRSCGGACTDCPFRTGANPLFADDIVANSAGGNGKGLDPNVCTKPSCLTRKKQALFARTAEEQRKKYKQVQVLEPEEAKKVFPWSSDALPYGSKYVDMADKPGNDLLPADGDRGKVKAWDKLLKGVDVPVLVVQDPKGQTRILVERSVAITAVQQNAAAKGQTSPLREGGGQKEERDAWQLEQKKREEEQKRDKRAYAFALQGISDKVLEKGLDVEAWWLVLDITLHNLNIDNVRLVAAALNVKPEGKALDQGHYAAAILEHLKATDRGLLELQSVLVISAATHQSSWKQLDSEYLKKVAGHFGVSIVEAKNKAKDELKVKNKAKTAKGKAEGDEKAPAKTENINADLAVKNILAEGDKERAQKPSRKAGTGMFARGPEGSVTGDASVFAADEKPVSAPPEHLDRVFEYKQANPTHATGTIAAKLGISVDDACACVDYIIDQKYDAIQAAKVEYWTLEQKAWAYRAGTHDMGQLIGPKPGRADKDAVKAWDRKRKAVTNAVEKLPSMVADAA